MKKNLKIKSLLGALALMVVMSGNKAAKAELTEDEGWNQEGTPTYEEITQEDIDQHTQDPQGTQDGEAKISDVPASPIPTIAPTGTDWEGYEPTEDDLHPSAGLPDEIERKDPTPTPTQPIPKTGDESNTNGGSAAGVVGGLTLFSIGGAVYALNKVNDARKYKATLLKDDIKKMH